MIPFETIFFMVGNFCHRGVRGALRHRWLGGPRDEHYQTAKWSSRDRSQGWLPSLLLRRLFRAGKTVKIARDQGRSRTEAPLLFLLYGCSVRIVRATSKLPIYYN